jgi:hypothetical protein
MSNYSSLNHLISLLNSRIAVTVSSFMNYRSRPLIVTPRDRHCLFHSLDLSSNSYSVDMALNIHRSVNPWTYEKEEREERRG